MAFPKSCVTQIAEVEIYFIFILLRRRYDYVCLFLLGTAYRKSWEKIINFIDFPQKLTKVMKGEILFVSFRVLVYVKLIWLKWLDKNFKQVLLPYSMFLFTTQPRRKCWTGKSFYSLNFMEPLSALRIFAPFNTKPLGLRVVHKIIALETFLFWFKWKLILWSVTIHLIFKE